MYFFGFGANRRVKKGRHAMQVGASTRHVVELPGMGAVSVARIVNCLGDGCPKPQLLTLKALNQVPEGEVVELISDNPTAVETIPAMMLAAYGSHLATIRADGCWKVYVRKGL